MSLAAVRDRFAAALADLDAEIRALEAASVPAAPVEPEPGPQPPAATPAPATALSDPRAFFDRLRKTPWLGPVLDQNEVDGCNRLLAASANDNLPLAWAAYVLATAYHETAGTMRPIREYGRGQGRPYGQPGRNGGQVPYGRGDVQLTWDEGYERADRELGLNGALIANYDLALDPQISARIIARGMKEGWFTGKGMGLYLPARADIHQFANCRRVVNGLDKAALIAGYALDAQDALTAGGWR